MIRTGSLVLVVLLCSAPPRAAVADNYAYTDDEQCWHGSDVVGYRRCPRSAPWNGWLEHPYMFVGFGVTWRHLPRPDADRGERDVAARSTTSVSSDAKDDSNLGFVERVGFALSRTLYVGFEAEFGGVMSRDDDPGARHLAVAGLGLLGVQGGIGIGLVGIELGAGGRFVTTELGGDQSNDGEGVIEVRGRAELWMGPWASLGAALGTSLLTRGEWMGGLYLTVHTRSFGGQP